MSASIRRSHWPLAAGFVIAAALPSTTLGSDAASPTYRVVGAGASTTAARATSPAYDVYVAGGSGAATGIAASPNASVVSGATSTELPTDRIFTGTFEN